ncbi:hypothetical protein IAU59_006759 [Kwoniella sp. CBS 9459]
MAQPEEVEQDLSHIHWSWPEAIAANPARSLANGDLAMDYFAYSPFWDSKSNNNVLRTQRRVENPTYGHAEEKIELNAFKSGFEYIIAHAQPPDLFVVHRREVEPTGKRDRVTGSWFVLHEKIYQSPTVYGVVSTRLRNAAHLISKTLGTLAESRPASNPRATTIWRSLPAAAAGAAAAPSSSTSSSSSSAQRQHKPTPDRIASNAINALTENGQNVDQEQNGIANRDEQEGEQAEDQVTQEQEQEFDWHLFHALQSTRSALSNIDEMARKPLPMSDPRAEMRSIEANMASQFSFLPQTHTQQQNDGSRERPGSVRSMSIGPRGTAISAGLTPGLSPGIGIGTGPLVGGGGGSSMAAPSPRQTGLGIGPSPVPRAVSIAAASPGVWMNGQI